MDTRIKTGVKQCDKLCRERYKGYKDTRKGEQTGKSSEEAGTETSKYCCKKDQERDKK